jgi:hypothetical protein
MKSSKSSMLERAYKEVEQILSPSVKWSVKKKMGDNLMIAATELGNVTPFIKLLESGDFEAQVVAVSALGLSGPEAWAKVGAAIDLVTDHPNLCTRLMACDIKSHVSLVNKS